MATVANLPPRSGVYDVLREQWEEKKSPELGFHLVELMISLRNGYEELEFPITSKVQFRGTAGTHPEEESLIREALEINSEAHSRWETRGNYKLPKKAIPIHGEKMWAERWYKHWDLCFTRQRAELFSLLEIYGPEVTDSIGNMLNAIELAEKCPRIRLDNFFKLLSVFETYEEEFSAKKLCSLYWRKIQSDFTEDMGAPKNNDPIRGPRFFAPSEKSFNEYDRGRESHPRSSKWIEAILREDWDYEDIFSYPKTEENLEEFIEAQIGYSRKIPGLWRDEWILDAMSTISDMTLDQEKKQRYASMWEAWRRS